MGCVTGLLTRAVPSTGETLPVIGLGTWQTFDVASTATAQAPLEAVLRTFVDSGGRLVDSSPMYGRAEQVVGDLSSRVGVNAHLFVATKVWTQGKAAGIRQMEASMPFLLKFVVAHPGGDVCDPGNVERDAPAGQPARGGRSAARPDPLRAHCRGDWLIRGPGSGIRGPRVVVLSGNKPVELAPVASD